jgi:hypothetical protein
MSTIIKRSLLISSLLLSLSCSLFSQILGSDSQPATSIPAGQLSGQDNPISISTDQVEVDYLCTSELITILYPLYGDILDDFTIATVTNNNDEGVRVVVESEIVGYTSLAIDTVDIKPYETVEIRQNPLLIPEVIEPLDTQKPADFHLRVSLM